MTLTTAQTLFLTLTRPNGDPAGPFTDRGLAVAAGALVDLMRSGEAELTDDRSPRLRLVRPEGPVAALFARRDGKRVDWVVNRVKWDVARQVGTELADAGLVTVETHLGGLTRRYPLQDEALVEGLRRSLSAVVAGQAAPTAEQLGALGVAKAAGSVKHLVVDGTEPHGRALGRRVDELLASDERAGEVSQAVRRAVQAAASAAAAAGVAAAVVAGS